jgi:hypothetical protein
MGSVGRACGTVFPFRARQGKAPAQGEADPGAEILRWGSMQNAGQRRKRPSRFGTLAAQAPRDEGLFIFAT